MKKYKISEFSRLKQHFGKAISANRYWQFGNNPQGGRRKRADNW